MQVMSDRIFKIIFWSIFGLAGAGIVAGFAVMILAAVSLAKATPESLGAEVGRAVAAYQKAADQ